LLNLSKSLSEREERREECVAWISSQVNLSVQALVGAPAETAVQYVQWCVMSAAHAVLSLIDLQAVHCALSAAFVAQLPDALLACPNQRSFNVALRRIVYHAFRCAWRCGQAIVASSSEAI
jgi:hypothetical protein